MKRIIRLSDCVGIEPKTTHPAQLVQRAIQALIKADLRFDNRCGRIHDKEGNLERYVSQSDFTPLETLEDVMRWEFSRHINNACQRILNGYSAH